MNQKWDDLLEKQNGKISQSNEKYILLRNDNRKITGLIISAGLSSRMGDFKPLLKYKEKSFVCNIIDKLLLVCEKVVVVTGHNSDKLVAHILNNYPNNIKIKIIFNSDYEKGMFTSIQKGIEELGKTDWVLYHQVDQPNLPLVFYTEFVNEIDINYDWVQPQCNGRKGHPILLNRKILEIIKNDNIEGGLRVISNYPSINKKIWDTNYREILTDIDTPGDIKKMEGE